MNLRCLSILVLLILATLSRAADAAADFPVATPESEGLQSQALVKASQFIREGGHDVRSVLVLRNGRLILEWYAGGITREHNHNLYSITKSVVATLVGLAVDQGRIRDRSVTLGETLNVNNPRKAGITLQDLLTMRSGFPAARAIKPTGPERDLFTRINRADDRVAAILDEVEMAREPGRRFQYGNIDPQLALAMLEKATGAKAIAYARQTLFEPLGFQNASWDYPDQTGRVPGGYGVRLRTVDLAKLGQLYLDKGRWQGRQILSESWIAAAGRDQTGTGYGFYWWVDRKAGSFSGLGVRGQRLDVFPHRRLVIAINSELPQADVQPVLRKLVREHLLKAIVSDQALPADPAGVAALRRELKRAAEYVPATRRKLVPARLPRGPDGAVEPSGQK